MRQWRPSASGRHPRGCGEHPRSNDHDEGGGGDDGPGVPPGEDGPADRADAEVDGDKGLRFSYRWDLGRSRLIMVDSRNARILDSGDRKMLGDREFAWLEDQIDEDPAAVDHLILGSSLPWLMPPAIHHLEAWNERTADSTRPRTAELAEKIRRTFDLEHWAAFTRSFNALGELFRRLGEGGTGAPGHRVGAGGAYAAPASISVLSGDVHHSYVAEAVFGTAMATPVMQLTCSPVHRPAPARPPVSRCRCCTACRHRSPTRCKRRRACAFRSARWC